MHSSDRTLLAKHGFDDRDRREPSHDLACQYLAQPESSHRRGLDISAAATVGNPKFEHPLIKGEGKYRTTIGFIDLIIPCRAVVRFVDPQTFKAVHIFEDSYKMCIEVKVNPVGIGDLLRQIKMYQEYMDSECTVWIVATTYAISRIDQDTMRTESIEHVQLGDRFKSWAEDTGASGSSSSLVL